MLDRLLIIIACGLCIGSLSAQLPPFSFLAYDNPAEGELVLGLRSSSFYASLIATDSLAAIATAPSVSDMYQFRRLDDGMFAYYHKSPADSTDNGFVLLDQQLQIVDTLRCANGYKADFHIMTREADGTTYLGAYDPQRMDLSALGGSATQPVLWFVIQEFDANHNLTWQWRARDHFLVTDMNDNLPFAALAVDNVHANAVFKTQDGNILLCNRHMDEITKIDRLTGSILWRLGGENSDFVFINDAQGGFSHPHDVQELPNGNIILFDNGNWHPVPESRAKEYQLDLVNMTATLVWQYPEVSNRYSKAMGSLQRLPNGNTFINWGIRSPGESNFTEVRPDGTEALDIIFTGNAVNAYVVEKHDLSYLTSTTSAPQVKQLEIFPSVTSDLLVLPSLLRGASLRILTVQGKIVKEQTQVESEQLHVADLAAGVYVINVYTEDVIYIARFTKL